MRNIQKNETISKQYSCSIKNINEDDKTVTFLGTTTDPDRDGDIVMPKGANMNNFRNNPVFLWGHDWAGSRPPIGKSVDERVVENGIEFDIKFDEDDDFAMQVYNKYKNKFLNAVSIGFSINDYEKRKDDNNNVIGYKFTDWELLELSGVPIPANPNALQRMAKGMADDIEREVSEMVHKAEVDEGKVEVLKSGKRVVKIISEARTPSYDDTEETEWDRPTLEDVVNALGYEDVESVDDLSEEQRNEVAGLSLLGDPDADTFDELTFFIVVNPDGKNLNKNALSAVRGGRGQQADIPQSAYNSADAKAKELLEEEFDVNYEEDSLKPDKYKEVAKTLAEYQDEPHEQEDKAYKELADRVDSLIEKLQYLQGKTTK